MTSLLKEIKVLWMKLDANRLRAGIIDDIIAGIVATILVSTTNKMRSFSRKKYFETAGMLNIVSRILVSLV